MKRSREDGKHQPRQRLWRICICVVLLTACFTAVARAAEASLSGRVTYEIADGVYVNIGTDQGLRAEIVGSLTMDDGRTFAFEVLHVARQSALLRLANRPQGESFIGRDVELSFQAASTEQTEDAEQEEEPPGVNEPATEGESKEFVPLLTPPKRLPEVTAPRNVSHGRVQLRQMVQTDSETDLDYWITRLSSSGSIDRIESSPWSFRWSGSVRYRDGDAYVDHPEYQRPHLSLYEAVLQRPIAEDGFLRLGRFLPHELPAIGYVDGTQGEMLRGEHLRLGAVAGLKPSRTDLQASADEPLAAGYATFEAGSRDRGYYSGTVGVLGSLYDSETNRLALLVDQRGGVGSDLTVYSTAVVDFDVGAAETHDGARLARLDLYGVSKITSAITLRGGLDHWERPDNLAERDLLIVDDDRYFDDGYWRYWIGSGQRLSKSWRFTEEVSFINSDNGQDGARWRVGATRTGLFGQQNTSVSVTVYNLLGDAVDGYGGRISGYLPLLEHKLFVQSSAGFRMLETDPGADDFALSYLALRLDARLSKNWSLQGGGTYSFGDNVDARLFDAGIRYAW